MRLVKAWRTLQLSLFLLLLLVTPALAQTSVGTITTGGSDCSVPTRCVIVTVGQGVNTVLISPTGTFSATVQVEYSPDNQTTWRAFTVVNLATLGTVTSFTGITADFVGAVNNFTHIRLRASTLSSGTVNVNIRQSANNSASGTGSGGGGGGGGAVTVADGADSALGATTDSTCAGDTTSGCTVEARLQRATERLTTAITRLGANGDAASLTGSNAAQLRSIGNLLGGGLPAAFGSGGGVKVDIVSGAGSGGTASNFGAAFPSAGTAVGATDGTNMVAVRTVAAAMDATANVLAAGLVGQLDDTGTAAVTENQFAPIRISTRRALLVEGVASGTTIPVSGTVTANMGTVTADPFGANADAASATGSISAKLRFIAATGIPITSVPADPFGANADAASATGSISAKLRFIAATGIPITGTSAINITQIGGATQAATNPLFVRLTDGAAAITPSTLGTHDTALGTITSVTGGMLMARASAADCAAVSADGDAVLPCADRAGNLRIAPSTAGGWSSFLATAADGSTACTSTAQAVKASAGAFGGFFFNNSNTTDEWIHYYDVAAASVTVGTTNPKLSFKIPGVTTSPTSIAAVHEFLAGIPFGTAIAVACTSTAGGNGAPSTALEVTTLYK